ncbi:MAG: hypothetical protein U0V70_17840 [Terriglobia bacterium]
MCPDIGFQKGLLWIPTTLMICLCGLTANNFLFAASHSADKKTDQNQVSVQVVFGQRDRQIIHEYCAQPNAKLPPGLAKRNGKLPPGLEKHLRRNGQLPPGLQKKVEQFPVELERLLPPLPKNYVRVFLGGQGMILDAQFNIIDIMQVFK